MSDMYNLLKIIDQVEKPVAINESVSLSINATGDSSGDVIDMMSKVLNLSGMKPVTPDMIQQKAPPMPMVQAIKDVNGYADEAASAYADEVGEEWENQPEPEVSDTEYMTKDLAGGLNAPHKQFKKEYPGDNPMSETLSQKMMEEWNQIKQS